MRTLQRLTEAYNSARVEYFDDNSKFVFISDCHRGSGDATDEFNKNQNVFIFALEVYLSSGFSLVEAGDGDELWEFPRFRPIKNAHSDVFELMMKFHEKDRLILMYGNHNIYLKDQEYVEKNYYDYFNERKGTVSDFLKGIKPIEALVLRHSETGQEILTVHGHQGDFANDQSWMISMFSLKYFWRFIHSFGFRNPGSPVANVNKRHKIEKNYSKWIEKNRMMLICGHTHRFKYPKENDLPYFNTGCCIYPTSITAIEIAEGNVQLVRWRTLPNPQGYIEITRDIMRGPEPIKKFDLRQNDERKQEARTYE
jgi:UDP-2,3-diacylglucosamine pyrophosphatase LpxH